MAGDVASTYWGLEGRRCGACSSDSRGTPAQLYCRSCAAYLCRVCDATFPAHARRGHVRVWVCEVCEQAPAAVTCRADAAALCRTCDADIHDANPLAQRHERVPIEPLEDGDGEGCCAPAVGTVDLNVGPAGKDAGEGRMDYLFSDLDPYLDLEYAAAMNGVGQLSAPAPVPVADCVVPFESGNSTGGGGGGGGGGVIEIDFAKAKASYSSYAAADVNSLSHSMSSSEVGVVPDHGGGPAGGISSAARAAPPAPVVAVGEEREARLLRYREKRKNRRFEKTIRYASRKAYAESRPRVKGRFAKLRHEAESSEAEAEEPAAGGKHAYFSPQPAMSFMLDAGYGVVPTFL